MNLAMFPFYVFQTFGGRVLRDCSMDTQGDTQDVWSQCVLCTKYFDRNIQERSHCPSVYH